MPRRTAGLKITMPTLPAELIHEAVRLSLLPSSSPSSSASSSSTSFQSSTPTSSSSPSRSPEPQRPSKAALLRSYSLTSHLFLSISQPLLFRDAFLPTLSATLSFLSAVEADAELAGSVRSVRIGKEGEKGIDAGLVMRRIAEACGGLREMRCEGMTRVRIGELEGMKELRTLTFISCLVAPSPSASFSISHLTHLTLSSLHLTAHSLPPSIFPSLTALSITTPRGSIASSPGQLASFLSAVAPQLRSLALHDQASTGSEGGLEFNPLLDALGCFSPNLTHLSTGNAHPFTFLPFLSPAARRSLRTLSTSLEGPLATGRMRWQPVVDSLLRDCVQVLEAVLLAPNPGEETREGRQLPAWTRELNALERVYLPSRTWEKEGLRGMVEKLQTGLRERGRGVEVRSPPEVGKGEGREPGGTFWREVEVREREEKRAKREAEEGWW